MAATGIQVVLVNGETRGLAMPEGSDPGQLLDAFISDNNPFGGEWLETDDGQYLRKSAIVRAFVQTDDGEAQAPTQPPGFPKTARPYNIS
jgi:hypothetical protein